jgi:hypothetical protein
MLGIVNRECNRGFDSLEEERNVKVGSVHRREEIQFIDKLEDAVLVSEINGMAVSAYNVQR